MSGPEGFHLEVRRSSPWSRFLLTLGFAGTLAVAWWIRPAKDFPWVPLGLVGYGFWVDLRAIRSWLRGPRIGSTPVPSDQLRLGPIEEGRCPWALPDGTPLPLTPEEGWAAYLGLLGDLGWPTARRVVGMDGWRLVPDGVRPRRYPDRAPGVRETTEGSVAGRNGTATALAWGAWLLGTGCFLVTLGAVRGWGGLDFAPVALTWIALGTNLAAGAWMVHRALAGRPATLRWDRETRRWEIRRVGGGLVTWDPEGAQAPVSLWDLDLSAPMDRPTAWSLFMDDVLAWRWAKRKVNL